jgi:hypothetical protein
MRVPVMSVREVRVYVVQRFMRVPMGVRFRAVPGCVVPMLVVSVMRVQMFVLYGQVVMRVFVPLGEVQPNPRPH